MQNIPFNLLDELFLHLEKPDEPFSMHLEFRVEGRLDPEKLLAAIHKAASLHPMARAFQMQWQGSDREYRWGITDNLAVNPLTVVPCQVDFEVEKARSRLMSEAVPLHASPPFRCLLVQHPEGDYFMMNISHAVTDGTGQARLMRSIVRAYAGQPDPLPSFDPLEKRNLSKLFGAPSLRERIRRFAPLAQYLVQSVVAPARVSIDGGLDLHGFGFHMLKLNAAELAQVEARREGRSTVNDVLLAASHLTIQEWNQQHGRRTERLTTMMPLSLRPAEWHGEVVGNYSVFVAVGSQSTDRQSFGRTLKAVTRWSSWYKETRGSAQLIDLLRGAPWLPLWLKRASRDLIPLTGNRVVDSTALTNLGRVDDPGSFGGRAGKITEFWFSPPARMPLGVSMGAMTVRGELYLTFRYRKTQFDGDAAARYAKLYRQVLLGEEVTSAVKPKKREAVSD